MSDDDGGVLKATIEALAFSFTGERPWISVCQGAICCPMRSVFDLMTDALGRRGAVTAVVLAFNGEDVEEDVDK